MSWINSDNTYRHDYRSCDYNNSIVMTKNGINGMMAGFDTIFDSFLNFTETISSIVLFPFVIKPMSHTGNYVLRTAKGVNSFIPAERIDFSNYYLTLGQHYVAKHFNNFADYNGYTQMQIFLPLLGMVDVDINECLNKYLQIRLAVDYFTGKGMYILGVSNSSITQSNAPYANASSDSSMRVIANYEVNIGIEIPLGSSNIGDIKRNLLLAGVKVGTSLIQPPSTPPVVTTTTTSTKTYDVSGKSLKKGSRMKKVKTGTETAETTSKRVVSGGKTKYDTNDAFNDSIDALNRVRLGGSGDRVNDSGLTGQLDGKVKICYYRPKLVPITETFKSLYGTPLGEIRQLDLIHGYVEVSKIHFEGVGFGTATSNELEEINNLFLSGVILP